MTLPNGLGAGKVGNRKGSLYRGIYNPAIHSVDGLVMVLIRTSIMRAACLTVGIPLLVPFWVIAEEDSEYLKLPYQWKTSTLPDTIANPGSFVGIQGDYLIVGGGSAIGARGVEDRKLSDRFSAMGLPGSPQENQELSFVSASPQGFGTTASSPAGVFCIGGIGPGGPTLESFVLTFDTEARSFALETLPLLPQPSVRAGSVVFENRVYVGGGTANLQAGTLNRVLWMLDLQEDHSTRSWRSLPHWPGPSLVSPILVVQDNGYVDALYVMGGRDESDQDSLAVWEMDLKTHNWRRRRDLPEAADSIGGVAISTAHILVLPGSESPVRKERRWLAYHTFTDTWTYSESQSWSGQPLALWNDEFGIRVPLAQQDRVLMASGKSPTASSNMHMVDYTVLIIYFAVLIAMGYRFSKSEHTTDDYFRGGKRVPGWAAGISIIGTKFSAISFMSIPAVTFARDWTYFSTQATILAAALIVNVYFIPFFRNLDVTTAYEYLESRFNIIIRSIGSMKFVLFEIFRMGALVLLPSLVLSVITGINLSVCIVIIGAVSTLYTYLGGIEAVIWTDVIQILIMIGGVLIAIGIAIADCDGTPLEVLASAGAQGKTAVFVWSWDITTVTVMVVLLSMPGAANNYVTNQNIVQRFISTPNAKEAARSMWVTAFVGPPILFLFYVMGTAMFAFYQAHPAELNPSMKQGDEVLAWFVVQQLPIGISGLMIGAVFAATMSSLDSALSSTSSVFVTDIYRRFNPSVTEKRALRLAKALTILLGVLGTASALVLAKLQIKSLFDYIMEIIGLFSGGLAGIYFLGIFTTRANSAGALIGFAASASCLYYFKVHTPYHFFLYGAVGLVSCFTAGYLASLLLPGDEKSLVGLTIHTR